MQPPLTRDEAEGIAWLIILAAHALIIAITAIVVVTRNRPGMLADGALEVALAAYTFRFLRSLKRRLS
jgi:hypothetical protein